MLQINSFYNLFVYVFKNKSQDAENAIDYNRNFLFFYNGELAFTFFDHAKDDFVCQRKAAGQQISIHVSIEDKCFRGKENVHLLHEVH